MAFGKTPLYAPNVKHVLTIKNADRTGPLLVVTLPTNLPAGISIKLLSGPRDATQLSFGPLASAPIEIDYSPTKDGKLKGSLVFMTNDPKHSRVAIRLTGKGVGRATDVTKGPPIAIFLGDADGSENVYTDSAGNVADAVIAPGAVPDSPHYGGVTMPLAYPLLGHSACDAAYADNPTGIFELFGGLVVGGGSYSDGVFSSLTSDVEAYDPCTKTFSTVGMLPTPVAWPMLTSYAVGIRGYDSNGFPLYDRGFAVIGGIGANGAPSKQVTVIWQDSSNGMINIVPAPPLGTGRVYGNAFGSGQTTTGYSDPTEFFVAGGIDSSGHVSDTFEAVCPRVGVSDCDSDIGVTNKLVARRAGAVATGFAGGIGLMGGVDDSGNVLSSTELIAARPNPSNGTMSISSELAWPLSTPRAFASSASLVQGFPFLIGGLSGVTFSPSLSVVPVGAPLSSTENFDCDHFQAGPPLNTARAFAGVSYNFSTSPGVLVVAGGIGTDGQPVGTIEIQRNALEPADPGSTGCSPPLYEPFELLPGSTSIGHPAPLSLTPEIPGFF